jgi:hypothetical protein
LAILEDFDNQIYLSSESLREFVLLWNSDHLIISHALCNGIPLISDDDKFPFYRGQGLELIENS